MAVTWNPADKSADITLSNGDLTGSNLGAAGYRSVRATISKSSGKWYWEITVTGSTPAFVLYGVGTSGMNLEYFVGGSAISCGVQGPNRYPMGGPVNGTGTPVTPVANDVISLLLDMDAGTLDMWKNGTTMGQMFTSISGTFFAACTSYSANEIFTANFGATAFAYTMPGGYSGYGDAAGGMNLFFRSFP